MSSGTTLVQKPDVLTPLLPASNSSVVPNAPTGSAVHLKSKTLSKEDLAVVCGAIGCIADPESHTLVRIKSAWWPAYGLPDGLYKDVVRARTLSQYAYLSVKVFYNCALLLQLLVGATMTALASVPSIKSWTITGLAATNTVNAGILALLHNSGLPDRYQKDCNEYVQVELYLKELMNTGIVPAGWSRDDVIAHCYNQYALALKTVHNNKPTNYTATPPTARPSSSE